MESSKLRKLKVDLNSLDFAMDDQDRSLNDFFLDTSTRQIVYVPDDLDIDSIYEDVSGRYKHIPVWTSGYALMEKYIGSIDNDHIREELYNAISGRGAFRRFKDRIMKYPKIKDEWYQYSEIKEREEVISWLQSIGIDPIM